MASSTHKLQHAAFLLALAAGVHTLRGGDADAHTPDRPAAAALPPREAIQRVTVIEFVPGLDCPGCVEYVHVVAGRQEMSAGIDQLVLLPIDGSAVEQFRMMLERDLGTVLLIQADPNLVAARQYGLIDTSDAAPQVPVTVIMGPGGTLLARRPGKHAGDFLSNDEYVRRVYEWTAEAAREEFNLSGDQPALKGFDPVAYFTVGVARQGSRTIPARYRGITYHFADRENRRLFITDPERYVPTYGGWCATAMAEGRKVEIDPANFKVTGGRLFLFYKGWLGDARKQWNANEAELMRRADRHWNNVTASKTRTETR